jgi:hypothetical protein
MSSMRKVMPWAWSARRTLALWRVASCQALGSVICDPTWKAMP